MRRLLLLFTLGLAACKDGGRTARAEVALPSVDEATAFQRDHESDLRDGTTTALTAIAAHYVASGETLGLGLDGRTPILDPGSPMMVFAMGENGLVCSAGCGGAPVGIDQPTSFPLGPLTVVASPQSGPGRVLIHDPASAARASFRGLPWFEVNAGFIVPASIDRKRAGESTRLTTSRGLTKELPVFCELVFELAGHVHRLTGYVSGKTAGRTSVLVPFTDATTGEATYPVGRYLTLDVPDGANAIALDFNRATNPLCAHSEHFNCPIPPQGNHIETAVRAGERYQAH